MKKFIIATIVVLLSLSSISLADKLPNYYSSKGFENIGKINSIRENYEAIIIDDSSYLFADSVRVHSLTDEFDSLAKLRPNVEIAFRMKNDDQHRHITEVWILPDNYLANLIKQGNLHE